MAMGQLIWSALNELAHNAFHSALRKLEIVFHHVCESVGKVQEIQLVNGNRQLPERVFTISFFLH